MRVFNTKKEMLEFVKNNNNELHEGMVLYTLEQYKKYYYNGKTINEMVDVDITGKIPISQLPSRPDDLNDEYIQYETSFFNDNNIDEDTEDGQDKNKKIILFIFILIIIMNIAILITIFGNYNRDKQLLQEIERLERKIDEIEDYTNYQDGIYELEFM